MDWYIPAVGRGSKQCAAETRKEGYPTCAANAVVCRAIQSEPVLGRESKEGGHGEKVER
jgi:hypothetical protein